MRFTKGCLQPVFLFQLPSSGFRKTWRFLQVNERITLSFDRNQNNHAPVQTRSPGYSYSAERKMLTLAFSGLTSFNGVSVNSTVVIRIRTSFINQVWLHNN